MRSEVCELTPRAMLRMMAYDMEVHDEVHIKANQRKEPTKVVCTRRLVCSDGHALFVVLYRISHVIWQFPPMIERDSFILGDVDNDGDPTRITKIGPGMRTELPEHFKWAMCAGTVNIVLSAIKEILAANADQD